MQQNAQLQQENSFLSETELNNFPRLQPSGEVRTRPRRFALRRRG